MPNDTTRKDRYTRRLGSMKTERTSFDEHYIDLARFVSPRRGRVTTGREQNRGGKHYWNDIINGQASWALRVATAGIFNGIMSPSRPWLMLETDDPDLLEWGPAKNWFWTVQERMRRIFNRSNLYNMAPLMFKEELLFGTGCMSHEDDLQDLCRFYNFTGGSYWIAQNDRLEVDTIAIEQEMTVEQIVRKFSRGRDINPDISQTVRDQYSLGNYDKWYPVVQFIEPNDDFREGSIRSSERAFLSVHYEPGEVQDDKFLRRKGFDEFPFYCPRWERTNEDVYGTSCPGMIALGDTRQLQSQEITKAKGLAKTVSPPVHGPAALRNQIVALREGGGTFYDAPGQQNVLRSVYDVRLPLADMTADMERVENRINRAFYVDLFMAISAMEGVQPRNQLELMQRNQERLLQLGPALEQQFGDFLDPLISRTFNQMVRAGIVPPAPEALQNRPLRPRYVSSLAMAQQAISTGNIDRMVAFVGGLMAAGLSDGKKFNGDQAIDEYAGMIGAPPQLVIGDREVAEAREAEQQAAQQAQQMEMAQGAANVAKMAGDTKLDGDTLAGRTAQALGGQR